MASFFTKNCAEKLTKKPVKMKIFEKFRII